MLSDLFYRGVSPLLMVCRMVQNRLAPPVLILLYHRVTNLDRDPQLLAVSPSNFFDQMRYLKENFAVVGLEDDWTKIGKPAVVVTFDDGYADNVIEALPILEELEVPASFFVATDLLGTVREFWWDEVERVLLTGSGYPSSFELAAGGKTRRFETTDSNKRERLYREILTVLRQSVPEKREAELDRLRAWAGAEEAGRATHRVLSLEELRRLAASPQASVGPHTLSHSSLSALPLARQREEIAGSKDRLEEIIGAPARIFSYPFGTRHDYTAETVVLCRELGFSRTCSAFPGQWRAGTDLQQLPRQVVRDWDLTTFKRQLARFCIS